MSDTIYNDRSGGFFMSKSERGSDRYTVRIQEELQKTMLKRCKKDEITPSELIRKALKWYLLGRDCDDERDKDDPKV